MDAVELLTHTKGMDYFDYLEKIKVNPIAKRVKLADIAHNSDETRYAGSPVGTKGIERRRAKYARAKKFLED